MRKTFVLQSAQADYKKIRQYVCRKFGAVAWEPIYAEWKTIFARLQSHPELGSSIAELDGTGFTQFRKYLHKNAFVVYHHDDERIVVYMFIPTVRDFRAHLFERLLAP